MRTFAIRVQNLNSVDSHRDFMGGTMFKTILVPIDVSEMGAAAKALAIARKFTEQQDSKLILLNVVEELPSYFASQIPINVHTEAVSHARDTLTQMVEDYKLPSGTEVLISDGNPSIKILEAAQQTNADVIVIASQDPDLADYLLGSVAARVVRHAHCSVMVVRNVTL